MRHSTPVNVGLLIACLVGGWALAQQAAQQSTITFDRPVHFMAPDGSDVEVRTGSYHVESAGEQGLRLSPTNGEAQLLIQALPVTHSEVVDSPLPLVVATDEDSTHLVLLLPDKTALDASGTLSGVRSRADLSQPLTAFQ